MVRQQLLIADSVAWPGLHSAMGQNLNLVWSQHLPSWCRCPRKEKERKAIGATFVLLLFSNIKFYITILQLRH